MNDREVILELVQRYADGLASTDEVASLHAILQNNADARQLFRMYMELDATLADLGHAATLSDFEESGNKHTNTQVASGKPVPGLKSIRWLSIMVVSVTAVCLLLAILGLWSGKEDPTLWARVINTGPGVSIVRDGQSRPAQDGDQLHANELISVPVGSTAQVTVMGLGVATLGPKTRLRNGTEPRLVELEVGFASILAEKQIADRPWRIRTSQVEVAVVGTEFNIASSKGRSALRVSEGQVQLTNLHNGQIVSIHGGSRAIIEEQSVPVITKSRAGSVLLLTSSDPLYSHWDGFNQGIIDKLVNARVWELGFQVEVKHYEDLQKIDLSDHSLVIVSLFAYGIGEPVIERIGLAKTNVPVICLEPAAYPTLGMTVGKKDGGFGFRSGSSPVEFVDSTHPLSGGYVGQQDNLIRGIVGWGRPENEAKRIANLPGQPDQAVIFGYDTNQKMATFLAPARRVGLFLDPKSISEQTTESWKIFEAAVDWCVSTGISL